MVYNKQYSNNKDENNKSSKKSLSYGRYEDEGLIASREEMERGIERILRDIDS
jgi:hypothetical protein